MTGPEPMHRQELLELAALEAYGLLDEYESALFNRSFHHAPTSVQQEIIKLQEHLAADTTLLPSEEPRGLLRERVLAAVNQAIEQETPGPIASIGRRTIAQLSDGSEPAHSDSRLALTNTGQFWRAASFFLAATSLALLFMYSMSIQQHHELTRQFLDNNTGTQIEELIGPTFKDFFWQIDAGVTPVLFHATDSEDPFRAALLVNEEEGVAFLLTERMPDLDADQLLTLRVQDAEGRSHTLAQFESKDRLAGMHVAIDGIAMGPNMSWEISGPTGVIMRA